MVFRFFHTIKLKNEKSFMISKQEDLNHRHGQTIMLNLFDNKLKN